MAAELCCKNALDQMFYSQSCVFHSAASVGLDVINVSYLDLADQDGIQVFAQQAKDLGFASKRSIHKK